MSPPGRPKGEYRSAQHEGSPVSPPGRPKGEYRSAQSEGSPVSLVVGLTGGIGSGKSAVSSAFAALGVDVTDTDVLAHALTAPGEPQKNAVRRFARSLLGDPVSALGEVARRWHREAA